MKQEKKTVRKEIVLCETMPWRPDEEIERVKDNQRDKSTALLRTGKVRKDRITRDHSHTCHAENWARTQRAAREPSMKDDGSNLCL